MPPPQVRTRLIIISDTHGKVPAPPIPQSQLSDALAAASAGPVHEWAPWLLPSPFREPLPSAGADVLVHCGDLSAWAAPDEFRKTLASLRRHPAPLKLVIAGNHDCALEPGLWSSNLLPQLNDHRLVMDMFRDAREDGVVLLEEEGTYEFVLGNGARLRVFASAWTPMFGNGAFQYKVLPGDRGHEFAIPHGIDLVVTHGPPYGVLDRTRGGTHVGARALWRATARARPKVHCFGHIHESWGATMLRWKGDAVNDDGNGEDDALAFDRVVDSANSVTVVEDAMVKPTNRDDEHVLEQKRELWREIVVDGMVAVDLEDGRWKTDHQDQTLFINASIMDVGYRPINAPWVVDMALPRVEADAPQTTFVQSLKGREDA